MRSAYRLLFGLAAAMSCSAALAQASATAGGSVVIVDPPQLAKQTEIEVAPVTRPKGARSVTAQAVAARYAVSGVAGDTFNIATPTTLRLVRAGGTEEVLLTLKPSGATTSLTGAYGVRSTGAFDVEGALGVTGQAVVGVYEGAFPVILSLQ